MTRKINSTKIKNICGYYNSKLVRLQEILGVKTATFDLLAGHTCPMANDCMTRVMLNENGKKYIEKMGKWMCYAAKSEAVYPAVYALHLANKERSLSADFVNMIVSELTRNKVQIMRIHSSGDFYDFTYFQKWVEIAKQMPNVQFFAYTKQATFVKWLLANPLPNFQMVYSHGGILDNFAKKQNLPTCYVETDDEKFDVPLACDNEYADDYFHVIGAITGKQESFKIAFH